MKHEIEVTLIMPAWPEALGVEGCECSDIPIGDLSDAQIKALCRDFTRHCKADREKEY